MANNTADRRESICSSWGGGSTITPGPEYLTADAPYDFTVVNMDVFVGDAGGSFDVQVLNNGAPIPGLSVTVLQPYNVNVVAISQNIIAQGTQLSLLISNVVGSPTNCYVNLNCTTNSVSEPLIGVSTFTALGQSIATGVMTSALNNSFYGFAMGQAFVSALSMAGASGYGLAFGNSTATASGAGIQANTRIGSASGTAIVSGVGSSSVGAAAFRLDIDGLDLAPLG